MCGIDHLTSGLDCLIPGLDCLICLALTVYLALTVLYVPNSLDIVASPGGGLESTLATASMLRAPAEEFSAPPRMLKKEQLKNVWRTFT